nr:tail fiber domain-containing protein [Hymenobacter negativus]
MKLRGVTYYWRRAEFPAKQFEARRQLGFIAQEIEPFYPEMVSTDADGYKSVDYSRLTPVLVEALKEQQQQIEALKARAASAEAKATSAETKAAQATATLDTFEARLRRLEAATGGQAQR